MRHCNWLQRTIKIIEILGAFGLVKKRLVIGHYIGYNKRLPHNLLVIMIKRHFKTDKKGRVIRGISAADILSSERLGVF